MSDPRLDEASGLATSRTNKGVYWTHNDSGDLARVFAINDEGAVLATFGLDGADALDYEDIAVSYGDSSEVWVADTGDNFFIRPSVQLYHFVEPEVTATDAAQSVRVKQLDVRFQDPSGGYLRINSEAFFMDPTGNGYLVEKTQDTIAGACVSHWRQRHAGRCSRGGTHCANHGQQRR